MTPVDEMIDAIYEASVHPDRWRGTVEGLTGTFRAATGALYVENHAETFGLLGTGVIVGHSAAAVAAYADYFCGRNPFNGPTLRSQSIGVITDTRFDSDTSCETKFHESEYYNDWARPQHLRHVMGQRIRSSGSAVLCAAFWRPGEAGAYSSSDADDLHRIVRHINRAIDIGARLSTAEQEMEVLLGRMPGAVLTLSREGVVRQMNAMADRLVQAGCGLSVVGGRLRTAVPQDQAGLERLILCAGEARLAAWAENANLALRRADGRPPLTVRAIAVAQRFAAFAPDRSASIVLVVDGFGPEREEIETRLRRRFALSPAQARVAAALHSGADLRQASIDLGLSVETVRSHLKAIFERTGTRRQIDLVMLLKREMEK